MARSSRRFGLTKMPGVSTNTSCAGPSSAIASTRVRVVCTLGVTIETLEPTRLLSTVERQDDREQRGRRDLLGRALRAPLAGRRRNALDLHGHLEPRAVRRP